MSTAPIIQTKVYKTDNVQKPQKKEVKEVKEIQ